MRDFHSGQGQRSRLTIRHASKNEAFTNSISNWVLRRVGHYLPGIFHGRIMQHSDLTITSLEALLLTNLTLEEVYITSDIGFRDDYLSLASRGLVRIERSGVIAVTVRGDAAIDAWLVVERELRSHAQVRPAEFALSALLGIALATLAILF